MITTVGDQIFTLNQEVRKLKKQCQRYETALRDIAANNGQVKASGSPASLAQRVLTPEPANIAS